MYKVMSIEANMAAREAAELIRDLCQEEAAEHVKFFWRILKKLIGKSLPQIRRHPERARPMTEVEAKVFGASRIPFGEFVGRRVDDVPKDRLDWYASTTFQEDLRRYLESERVKRE